MSNEINVMVQNQMFHLNRQLLISESQNRQIKMSKDFTLPFPQWVTRQVYFLIQKYLKLKDVSFMKTYINDNQVIIKVLRTADYLGMLKFHDKYINQILIPNINHFNCLTLLEQSHKKLKNVNDSQTWYNLLNMSIIYLSIHIFEIFKLNPKKFKKLNQKIINQVLQRIIRLQRKNNFSNKHILYQLILQCKQQQIGGYENLFKVMKQNLKIKKIHCNIFCYIAKIHAKLSWKLDNIEQLNEKYTKNFKYLDMNWFLKAQKTQQGLLITLNLLPFDDGEIQLNFKSSQSQVSESLKSQKTIKSGTTSNKSTYQRNEAQQIYRNDTFTRIAVFYSKVHWKYQQQTFQQDINIHYILMNEYNTLDVILIDKKMQKIIGSNRVQLTIYCNTQSIYTFLLNYVNIHYNNLKYKGKDFCKQQLQAMIKLYKKLGNYTQALKLTSQLLQNYPNQSKNIQLYQGFDFNKMIKIQIQAYNNILGKKLINQPTYIQKNLVDIDLSNNNNIQTKINPIISQQMNHSNISQRRTISPIPITPIHSISKKSTFSNSSSQLIINNPISISSTPGTNATYKQKIGSFNRTNSGRQHTLMNMDSLTNSRRDSRGSKRKIFSKPGSGQSQKKQNLVQEMMKITDLSLYLNPDPIQNPDYQRMVSLLKS